MFNRTIKSCVLSKQKDHILPYQKKLVIPNVSVIFIWWSGKRYRKRDRGHRPRESSWTDCQLRAASSVPQHSCCWSRLHNCLYQSLWGGSQCTIIRIVGHVSCWACLCTVGHTASKGTKNANANYLKGANKQQVNFNANLTKTMYYRAGHTVVYYE